MKCLLCAVIFLGERIRNYFKPCLLARGSQEVSVLRECGIMNMVIPYL